MTTDRPLVLAHRGDHTRARENTCAAIEAARAAGADGVELDVRRSADGELFVHHDPAAEGVGVLGHRGADEIRAVLPWLPTLREALETASGMRLVNLELKNLPEEPDFDPREGTVEPVLALVGELGLVDSVVLSSFLLSTLERARDLDGAFATAWLTPPVLGVRRAARAAAAHGCRGIHPHHHALARDPEDAIGRVHELGLAVRAWTVDDEHTLRRLSAAGVDALITDRPASAVAVVRERGGQHQPE